MSNQYYNHTSGQPVAISRGTSAAIRAEFDSVQAGFDSAQAAINAKGNVAGQTWTGTHDYSGGALKVATLPYGSSGAYAVSYDALNAAIFQVVLPGQPGGPTPLFLQTVNGVAGWGNNPTPDFILQSLGVT